MEGTAAERRKSQNYVALPHLLTAQCWEMLETAPVDKASSCLFRHCWALGLRCPSESTFNVLFNLVYLARTGKDRDSMSTFEKYCQLNKLKQQWKHFKVLKKSDDFQYNEFLEVLPTCAQEIPSEYYLDAFVEGEAVACRSLF